MFSCLMPVIKASRKRKLFKSNKHREEARQRVYRVKSDTEVVACYGEREKVITTFMHLLTRTFAPSRVSSNRIFFSEFEKSFLGMYRKNCFSFIFARVN
jgi:hypothetical protein